MLQNWFILLPEITLLLYLPVAYIVNRFRKEKTAKTFFTISKIFLFISIIGTIIFYNQSPFQPWIKNTSYSTLFKIMVYLLSLAWFYLSSKWFLNKNRSSYKFYTLSMVLIFLFSIMMSARHLLILSLILPLIFILIRKFILLHWDEDKVSLIGLLYDAFAALFSLFLWIGVGLLYWRLGNVEYTFIFDALKNVSNDIYIYLGVCLVVMSILFMLAAAPFHFWFISAVSKGTLPICGLLTLLVPPSVLFCLITLLARAFTPLNSLLHGILLSFAVFSLFIGAFSANGQQNIRRLFGFATIYNIGFLLLGLINFNVNAVMSVFAYEVVYSLAMLGVYTVFLGLKSKSEYLSDLEEISGISQVKPYISAALLVFMFSLVGMPPMLGFLGRLTIVNTLVISAKWLELGILLVSILFMANAFLNIIRAVYFTPLKNTFDRTDKAIYISLFINLLLVIISIINPAYVLLGAETALKGIF